MKAYYLSLHRTFIIYRFPYILLPFNQTSDH